MQNKEVFKSKVCENCKFKKQSRLRPYRKDTQSPSCLFLCSKKTLPLNSCINTLNTYHNTTISSNQHTHSQHVPVTEGLILSSL